MIEALLDRFFVYGSALILAFIFSVIFTQLIKKFALKKNILDFPEKEPFRKIHKKPIPLLGGTAIYFTVLILYIFYAFGFNQLLGGFLLLKHLLGILLGGFILMIGGYLDDRYDLKPSRQIVFPVLATLIIIASGIGINYFTNPLGGVVYLDKIKIKLFTLNNLPYHLTLWADLFTFIWLLGMMYTTKFLDGLDGLVSGITSIGAFIIFFLSLSREVTQPETALLAIILAGASLGFLVFNFYPAKIFLGEGGSLFCGFMLGVLSIIAGSKIATTLLIMGIPILDVAWVIIRRISQKILPWQADKRHLHFRLLDIGLSHRQAVIFLYILSLSFGITALFLKTKEKFYALVIQGAIMLVLIVILWYFYQKKPKLSSK